MFPLARGGLSMKPVASSLLPVPTQARSSPSSRASVPPTPYLREQQLCDALQGLLEQVVSLSGVDKDSLLGVLAKAASTPSFTEKADAFSGAINLDEEVADMASANLKYQALTESLNRHFGLMRLAVAGRN